MKNWIILAAALALLAAPVRAQEVVKGELTFGVIDAPEVILSYNPAEQALHFINEGGLVVSIDMRSGNVVYGEGYAADTAASFFWETVGRLFPRLTCDAPSSTDAELDD